MEAPEAHAGAIENDGDEDARHEEKVFSRGVKRQRLDVLPSRRKPRSSPAVHYSHKWVIRHKTLFIYSSPVRFGKSRLAGS
jgi:hypothetical protein